MELGQRFAKNYVASPSQAKPRHVMPCHATVRCGARPNLELDVVVFNRLLMNAA
jgi:hypothetical protein